MANTLTDLIPEAYAALDIVSRELTGFIPAVTMNSSLERVGLDDVIRIPVTPAAATAANTPGVNSPDTGDQAIANVTMAIDHSLHVAIRWNGEQTKSYGNTGLFPSTISQQIGQAMRTLTNAIETDIAAEAIRASRAFGTAATTPFASNLSDANNIAKMLSDNGAPMADRHLVVDTTAGLNLRNLTNLNQVNTSGTDATLRRGVLLPTSGLDVRESAQVYAHTAGDATSATTDSAGYAVGITSIVLESAGAGAILTGDTILFAGDTNKYLVVTGDAAVGGGGTIVIAKPGLKVAMSAATKAISIVADSSYNVGFHRSAIQLVTRMPAMPEGGDLAVDSFQVTDPNSGLSFEVALYKQFLQNVLHVRIAWGTKCIKPEHATVLLGA